MEDPRRALHRDLRLDRSVLQSPAAPLGPREHRTRRIRATPSTTTQSRLTPTTAVQQAGDTSTGLKSGSHLRASTTTVTSPYATSGTSPNSRVDKHRSITVFGTHGFPSGFSGLNFADGWRLPESPNRYSLAGDGPRSCMYVLVSCRTYRVRVSKGPCPHDGRDAP